MKSPKVIIYLDDINIDTLAEFECLTDVDYKISHFYNESVYENLFSYDFILVKNHIKHSTLLDNIPITQHIRVLLIDNLDDLNDKILQLFTEITIANVRSNGLISIFTTTYRSRSKIQRPFISLAKQTYKYWEWIIIDDSDDNDKTYNMLKKCADVNNQIKVFNKNFHSGNIGQMKRLASSLCTGEIIIELDHDDELVEDCFETLIHYYNNYPTVNFFYSDFSEIYENGNNFKYSYGWGYGFGSYYKQFYQGKWINVARSIDINKKTMSNIISVPNHLRSWRKCFLDKIQTYNQGFHVADDYELIIRTFLKGKMMRIPKLMYIQYKNENENNFSIIRGEEVTKLQTLISKYYNEDINTRCNDLALIDGPNNIYWENDYNYECDFANLMPEKTDGISVIISTYNRPSKLIKALESILEQTIQKFKIIIIGDCCPKLDDFMENDICKDKRITWWNLEKRYNDGGTTPKNYALRMLVNTCYVCYLDDDNTWRPEHLELLYKKIKQKKVHFTFSGINMYKDGKKTIILCDEPRKYRIDTSSFMHTYYLIEKYGYWRSHNDVGYAHDWELVSRWVKDGVRWQATYRNTLDYDCENSLNDPELIKSA